MEEENFFCKRCGEQLTTIDEIVQGICNSCKSSMKEVTTQRGKFFCWTCGKQLIEMDEIAQGICNNCKASIIRKLRYIHP